MISQDSVKSLMSSRVISVLPGTPVLMAIDIILSNNFNGIPVVDKSGVLVGILTKYDLISKRSSLRDDMKVEDIMNGEPLVLGEDQTVDDAIRAFAEHHKVDPIPVIDSDKKLVGVISRYDMVKMFKEYGVSFYSGSNPAPVKVGGNNNIVPVIVVGLVVLALVIYYFFL